MAANPSFQISAAAPHFVPSLPSIADPPLSYIDGAAMDYFLIEAVNALRASSAVAAARAKQVEQEMIEAGLIPAPAPTLAPLNISKESPKDSVTSNLSQDSSSKKTTTAEDDEEGTRIRLETIGVHVGANLAERLCHDRPLFADTLDAVKFICKDLWSACWDKQVDNLRTNHRGVYVLQDNSFKPISRMSSWDGRADALRRSKMYVALPAGIIKGALHRLGFQATVSPEMTTLPQCTFQVKMPKGS